MQAALDILGWSYKTEGPKSAPLAASFTTLGCVVHLSNALQGTIVVVDNQSGRRSLRRGDEDGGQVQVIAQAEIFLF